MINYLGLKVLIFLFFCNLVLSRESRASQHNSVEDEHKFQQIAFNKYVATDMARSALFYDNLPFYFFDKKPPGHKCPRKRKPSVTVLFLGDSIDRFAVIDGCHSYGLQLSEWGSDFDYRTPGFFAEILL